MLLRKRIWLVLIVRRKNALQDAILMIVLRMVQLLVNRYSLLLRRIVGKFDSSETWHRSGESEGYLWRCWLWPYSLGSNHDVFFDKAHILSIVILRIVLVAYQTFVGDIEFWSLWDRSWHRFDLQRSRSFLLFGLDESNQRSIFSAKVVVKRLWKRKSVDSIVICINILLSFLPFYYFFL